MSTLSLLCEQIWTNSRSSKSTNVTSKRGGTSTNRRSAPQPTRGSTQKPHSPRGNVLPSTDPVPLSVEFKARSDDGGDWNVKIDLPSYAYTSSRIPASISPTNANGNHIHPPYRCDYCEIEDDWVLVEPMSDAEVKRNKCLFCSTDPRIVVCPDATVTMTCITPSTNISLPTTLETFLDCDDIASSSDSAAVTIESSPLSPPSSKLLHEGTTTGPVSLIVHREAVNDAVYTLTIAFGATLIQKIGVLANGDGAVALCAAGASTATSNATTTASNTIAATTANTHTTDKAALTATTTTTIATAATTASDVVVELDAGISTRVEATTAPSTPICFSPSPPPDPSSSVSFIIMAKVPVPPQHPPVTASSQSTSLSSWWRRVPGTWLRDVLKSTGITTSNDNLVNNGDNQAPRERNSQINEQSNGLNDEDGKNGSGTADEVPNEEESSFLPVLIFFTFGPTYRYDEDVVEIDPDFGILVCGPRTRPTDTAVSMSSMWENDMCEALRDVINSGTGGVKVENMWDLMRRQIR